MLITLRRVTKNCLASLPFLALQAQVVLADVFGPIPDITDSGTTGDVRETVLAVLKTILSFLGLVAVIVIVIAGIRLIIGGANEEQRTKARDAVVYAIVGLVLILLARAIVDFVYKITV